MFSKVLSPATSIVIQFLFFAAKALIPSIRGACYGLIPNAQCQEGSTGSLLLLREQGDRAFRRVTRAAARCKFHLISLSRRKQLCLPLKSFWKLTLKN